MMKPLKIAFVGIGQSYVSHLWMQRMRQMLGDQIVVNIDDLRNSPRHASLPRDIQFVPRKLSRLMRVLRFIGKTDEKFRSEWMLQRISRSNASLVFVHFLNYATQFSEVWRRIDIPVVVHCHGYDVQWDIRQPDNEMLVHPAGYTDHIRSLPENVWFIANSSFTKRQLQDQGINPDKIFLKRFGVPLSEKPRSLIAKDRPVVLFLGRLIDCKGPIETVRAFSQIAGNHPQASLEVAGDGALDLELDDVIRELKIGSKVNRHGAVSSDRGAALRRKASIFTAHNQKGARTRQEESFGVSLLEAMGEGIPVVTGYSGGIPDFIKHQENGLLFEPGDIDAHAEMLDNLLSSKHRLESLGTAAWETVRDNYLPSHEMADMNRIFQHVSRSRSCPTLHEAALRQFA